MKNYITMKNYIGYLDGVPQRRVYVEIEIHNSKSSNRRKLSITGETVGGAFGQINLQVRPQIITPAKNLNAEKIERLFEIWDRWHLNNMNAGCEHQRAFARACGIAVDVLWTTRNSGNSPIWTCVDAFGRVQTHKTPVVCPICDYSYGSKWLYEAIPDSVLAFLRENFTVQSIDRPYFGEEILGA